jgi:N-acetylglucosaminyl-diphospho-decaprenol L-rhamnosyltransferase
MASVNKDVMLSIIIVNWNSWGFIIKCLNSIIRYSKGINYEVLVIDNASADNSGANIKAYFPWVHLIALTENCGFPKANNIGFAMARGKYLLALNPDTEVKENTLQLSLNFLEHHPEYGCVGVKTRKASGEIQLSCARKFPTFKGIIFNLLFIDKILPRFNVSENIDMPAWDHEDSRDIDMIAGSFMMFPKSLYQKIGGFDERILLFFEDVEYCQRIWNRGFKIRYLAEAEIIHYGGKSTGEAVPSWIARLRFEGFYLYMKDNYGTRTANRFVKTLCVLLPIKAVLLPFFCYGLYFKNRVNWFKVIFFETISGIIWSIEKLREISKNS